MSSCKIFVGMPAFNGAGFIQESLRSIAAQTCKDYRVMISVDGNDEATAAKCEPFLSDPRFALQMQQTRLGWDGNFNWLLSQAESDFFCYWQQDDLTTPDYLEKLLCASQQYPAAVCYYSDIQWFGTHDELCAVDSVEGFAVERALSIFQVLNGIPNRGLIRRSAIERTGPVARNEFESAFEEYVWIAKLAREGSLRRVPGPLYYKRAHGGATHQKWHGKPRLWRRQVWIEFGLGMLETIWPLLRPEERRTAYGIVLDRLCCPREGRFLFYDGPRAPFAFDFLAAALERYPAPELANAVLSDDRSMRFAGEIGGTIVDAVVDWLARGRMDPDQRAGVIRFAFGQAGVDLLDGYWSTAESWGVWSNGPSVRLRMPVERQETVRLSFTTFGRPGSKATIIVAADGGRTLDKWRVPANVVLTKELSAPPEVGQIEFSLPDAVSPKSVGHGEDARLLGLGLISLELGA